MTYPTTLTTSEWVDVLNTRTSRDEQIAALATWHRRIDYEARQSVLTNLNAPDGAIDAVLTPTLRAFASAIPPPVDYAPADTADAERFVGGIVTLADIGPTV